MNVYRAAQIRNVALISHGGAGKTSLVDTALFDAGAVTRIGKVEDATSISDTDADEIKRRMSINLTVIPVEWQGTKLNLLDTPGYADFVGEVMAGLRVADAALVVVTAEKGVEVGTELVWRHADEHQLPRMVFINKLDRENTSFERALQSLRAHFGQKVVPLQIPIGEQAGFSGVVEGTRLEAWGGVGIRARLACTSPSPRLCSSCRTGAGTPSAARLFSTSSPCCSRCKLTSTSSAPCWSGRRAF